MPPKQTSVRDPPECNCDYCAGVPRKEPSAISKWKCAPAVTVPIGSACRAPEVVIAGADEGVPYTNFCLCHCQPLMEGEQQCIAFTDKELRLADADGDGNCEDPQLPSQQREDEAEELKRLEAARLLMEAERKAAMEAAQRALAPSPGEAPLTTPPPDFVAQAKEIWQAADMAKMHKDEATRSLDNMRLLRKLR